MSLSTFRNERNSLQQKQQVSKPNASIFLQNPIYVVLTQPLKKLIPLGNSKPNNLNIEFNTSGIKGEYKRHLYVDPLVASDGKSLPILHIASSSLNETELESLLEKCMETLNHYLDSTGYDSWIKAVKETLQMFYFLNEISSFDSKTTSLSGIVLIKNPGFPFLESIWFSSCEDSFAVYNCSVDGLLTDKTCAIFSENCKKLQVDFPSSTGLEEKKQLVTITAKP